MTPDSAMNMGESVVGNSLLGEYADAVGSNSGPGGLPPDHQVCLHACSRSLLMNCKLLIDRLLPPPALSPHDHHWSARA